MGYAKIIALDLGKFKTVACVMDPATREHRPLPFRPLRKCLPTATNQVHEKKVRCSECGAGL